MIDGYSHQLPDIDPQETREWMDSLDAVVGRVGTQRAGFLIIEITLTQLNTFTPVGTAISMVAYM